MKNFARDLIGRSDGNQSTISRIYHLLPKETNWNNAIECDKECSDLKNDIQKQIFMKNLLSSLHKMKLGTFIRQFNELLEVPCQHCSKIEQMTCLEIGNMNCNNGTVNLMGIFEKMKFAYRSGTSEDITNWLRKLSKANFTYKMSTIATGEYEVIMILD